MSTPTFSLNGLSAAIEEAEPHLARSRMAALSTAGQAATTTNAEGGDPTSHADPTLLARHLGHYLAAAEIAAAGGPLTDFPILLDVGCGTGAYSAWLSQRLGLPLHLADHDQGVLDAASAVHDIAGTHLDVADAPQASLVTAMEVLEHIPPTQQQGFLDATVGRVAPGGVMVLSTPDESHYPGGWSGYAPHIGCVEAGQLASMLRSAAGPGRQVEVWRLTGGPYEVSLPRRLLESVANRVWTQVTTRAPAAAAKLAARSGSDGVTRPVLSADMVEGLDRVRVTAPDQAVGGAMIGVVRG